MHMFCYQCQETSMERGCTYFGACGKSDETANLQDLLIHLLRGVAFWAERAGEGEKREAGLFISESLFMTVTNTNFDPDRFVSRIREGLALRDRLRAAGPDPDAEVPDPAVWEPEDEDAIRRKSLSVDIRSIKDPDLRSLQELSVYGLKGAGAYAFHAAALGFHDDALLDSMIRSLAAMNIPRTESELEAAAVETGRIMIAAMALLDRAHAAVYGTPEIVRVPLGVRRSPGILITGHDLRDLEELLEQTEGTGVDVYTHSEMWAAHQYPRLRAFGHLAGNYGNAWWMQDLEFASFQGPILVTTNCIVPVAPAYKDRIFTTGVAGYPGVPHIGAPAGEGPKDFSRLIELARNCPPPDPIDEGEVTAGFSHHAAAPLLDKIVGAVRAGRIRKFVVMGGCDGRDPRRVYYTRLARALPPDTVILSAGCAKYRFIKLDLGAIDGIPRVLDAGQCNDCYSLVRIALALQEATGAGDINDLPLALDIAWYDQKAVGIILALAALGVRGIRIGPTLPAFLQTESGKRFMAKYDIFQIKSVEEDLAAIAG
ncbi:MAG: hydroxylamine reductase [Acidobacteria bacterium]|nr:hydroxylamine reductase [Acidobacteriota bacterium]